VANQLNFYSLSGNKQSIYCLELNESLAYVINYYNVNT